MGSVLGQDAWTGLPILAKPSGGTLGEYIEKHQSRLYSEPLQSSACRIKPDFLPLAYQWSLHLVSALSLIHSHDIAFGEIVDNACWLSSPSLSISLAGFVTADFKHDGLHYHGSLNSGQSFSPMSLSLRRGDSRIIPALQNDLFIYGRIVYQIMTSQMPGDGMSKSYDEIEQMVRDHDWPTLERQYLGHIVHKCWNYEYRDVEELKGELESFLESEGWEIEGEDEIQWATRLPEGVNVPEATSIQELPEDLSF